MHIHTYLQVGVDVVRLNIPSSRAAAGREGDGSVGSSCEIVLREVGAAMSSRWDAYLNTCGCLMVSRDLYRFIMYANISKLYMHLRLPLILSLHTDI
jgi:hypothetical protein